MYAENFDTETLVTPVKTEQFERLLQQTGYPTEKSKFLIEGFKNGFSLGYQGNRKVQMTSKNLKLTVGSHTELWNKVIKEVQLKRYAGPFEEIPFKYYIQSPIGLVPKDGETKTRLIFHLSYPRGTGTSVNANTPEELTTVKYPDFDEAVRLCILSGKGCAAAKSDMTAAFRQLCIRKQDWQLLVMKAKNPKNDKYYFFFDKCLPFGASISCAHFQAFSDTVSYIVMIKNKWENINYLDDFFFAAFCCELCNQHLECFIKVCKQINFPISKEKTEWAATAVTFLGLLIDTVRQIIGIPINKIDKAVQLIQDMLNNKKSKTTLHKLQKLCGYLNFLAKSVVPGRAFISRMYTFGAHLQKKHHHLAITSEMKMDLYMWLTFLTNPETCSRPFFEYDTSLDAEELDWYTDASMTLGCGGYHKDDWFIAEWDEELMNEFKPSINYLELFAVTAAILNWVHLYPNKKIVLFCDNMSVVHMVNNTSSHCKNCMVLIRLLVIHCMTHNVKVTAKHVLGETNKYADFLSRLKYQEFRRLARKNGKTFKNVSTPMPDNIWPIENIWMT